MNSNTRKPNNILGNIITKIIKITEKEVIWSLTRWPSNEGTGYQICKLTSVPRTQMVKEQNWVLQIDVCHPYLYHNSCIPPPHTLTYTHETMWSFYCVEEACWGRSELGIHLQARVTREQEEWYSFGEEDEKCPFLFWEWFCQVRLKNHEDWVEEWKWILISFMGSHFPVSAGCLCLCMFVPR